MPEYSRIAGHLLVLGRLMKTLPKDCTVHAIFVKICHKFPNGLCYIDIWPYSRSLLIVSTPSAALQVQQRSLPKDVNICAALNKIMGGESLLTAPDTQWKNGAVSSTQAFVLGICWSAYR
jgi:hypothetical protein